ncbi:DUF1048 domain-containing protein [Nocardia ninae]|uniref:DUF1048 domain-containing protein n=1 Tax=Nocardia ninae NBRC 108245 TaxID=1210091 RepID=A0A511MEU7_9NOCA|nr:DUF1048 domain-containing protein [Nocardia ninae]GEM38376.1 hypothetical protein NN4_28950 [Nocardia ninae NBRC 108245]
MPDTEKGGFISKVVGPKLRWRKYKSRVSQLPPNYRTAVEAIERYMMHFVPTDGEASISMFDDLADRFEQAAAQGTPIREIVGPDPGEFVGTLVHNYTDGGYVSARVRKKLIEAIAHAEK